jgi:tRNA(adenine34) deaminase
MLAEHGRWMLTALEEARLALARGEVPVGAVAVREGEIVGRGRNRTEELQDPTAHAEMLALREAAAALGSWRLIGVSLYVTLEPCAMCSGACVLGRIDRLVYGAADPKAGMSGSLASIPADPRLNHSVEIIGGVRANECGMLLVDFFRARRG